MGTVFSIDIRDAGDWDDAITEVVGWLHRADAVRLLHSTDYQRRGPSVEGIRAYLRWHEIAAEAEAFKPHLPVTRRRRTSAMTQ